MPTETTEEILEDILAVDTAILSVVQQIQANEDEVQAGLLADIPAAPPLGTIYAATDTDEVFVFL